jgi:mRNA interferase RelE/StbE
MVWIIKFNRVFIKKDCLRVFKSNTLLATGRQIAADPAKYFGSLNGSKAAGYLLHKIRVGDYRIIYEIQNEILVILVVKIGHRKDIYRNLP